MTTESRLGSYYNFDDAVLNAVSQTAEEQNRHDFKTLAARYGLEDGPQRARPLAWHRPIEYLYLQSPESDRDSTNVLLTPMGIPVDESIAMRAMRLHAAAPETPLLVFGSPALAGNHANLPHRHDLVRIAGGDLRPAVAGPLELLRHKAVSKIAVLGYSYGADAGAALAAGASDTDIAVTHGVFAEPSGVAERGLKLLLADFKSTEAQLQEYVDAADSEPLQQARELADHGFLRYAAGLARLSNLAIATALSQRSFPAQLGRALASNPDMHAALAWGSDSELSPTKFMNPVYTELRSRFAHDRLSAMRLIGMHHAGGDDIDLHAAIMLQGLEAA